MDIVEQCNVILFKRRAFREVNQRGDSLLLDCDYLGFYLLLI